MLSTLLHQLLLVGVLYLLLEPTHGHNKNINATSPRPTTTLEVYLVPHSHCDAGYKKTVHEYYITEVRSILNSITQYLYNDNNNKTKFVWSEIIYLQKWFQDPTVSSNSHHQFRTLVQSGRIEIVNGGFVMHDEAVTRFESQIQQTILGHDHVSSLLKVSTETTTTATEKDWIQTGYQIDPFGNSAFTPIFLWNAQYKVLITNRVPDYIKQQMKQQQALQFWWWTSQNISNNNNSNNSPRIFVNVYDTHYASPNGFDWQDPDTPLITPINVQQRADAFVKLIMKKSSWYKTPHILVPFGGDFHFQNATFQFHNMNQILKYINNHPNRYYDLYGRSLNLKYATVREYMDQLRPWIQNDTVTSNQRHQQHEPSSSSSSSSSSSPAVAGADLQNNTSTLFFPSMTGSPFLPLESGGVWSGFYTQYPALKQRVRVAELLLRSVDGLFATIHAATAQQQKQLQQDNGTVQNPRMTQVRRNQGNKVELQSYNKSNKKIISQQKARIEKARQSIMTMQHHDALPCTGYHHVMYDYAAILDRAMRDLTGVLGFLLKIKKQPPNKKSSPLSPPVETNIVGGGSYLASTSVVLGSPGSSPKNVVRIEMAQPTQIDIWNPRSRDVHAEPVHIFISRDDIAVFDASSSSGEIPIVSQVTPLHPKPYNDGDDISSFCPMVPIYRLSFFIETIPAFGSKSIILRTCYNTTNTDDFPPRGPYCAKQAQYLSSPDIYNNNNDNKSIKQSHNSQLVFDSDTGDLSHWINLQTGRRYRLEHSLLLYGGMNDDVYKFNATKNVIPKQLTVRQQQQKRKHPSDGDRMSLNDDDDDDFVYDAHGWSGPIYTSIIISYEGGHSLSYTAYNHSNIAPEQQQQQQVFGHDKLVQVDIVTSQLPRNANLMSRFQTNLISSSSSSSLSSGLYNVENGFQPTYHPYNDDRPWSAAFQPLTSHAWIVGNESNNNENSNSFHVLTVDPRGVATSGTTLEMAWHRRNQGNTRKDDQVIDLKSGDDTSRVRSSIWLSLEDNNIGEEKMNWKSMERAMASDLIAIQNMDHDYGAADMWEDMGPSSLNKAIPDDIYVVHINYNNSNRLIRLIVEGIGTKTAMINFNALSFLEFGKILNVTLHSLTFLYIKKHDDDDGCSLVQSATLRQLLVQPRALCAVEILFDNDDNDDDGVAKM